MKDKDKNKDLKGNIKDVYPDICDLMLGNKRAIKKAKQKKYFKEKGKIV
jgi:hypothetical protein